MQHLLCTTHVNTIQALFIRNKQKENYRSSAIVFRTDSQAKEEYIANASFRYFQGLVGRWIQKVNHYWLIDEDISKEICRWLLNLLSRINSYTIPFDLVVQAYCAPLSSFFFRCLIKQIYLSLLHCPWLRENFPAWIDLRIG